MAGRETDKKAAGRGTPALRDGLGLGVKARGRVDGRETRLAMQQGRGTEEVQKVVRKVPSGTKSGTEFAKPR